MKYASRQYSSTGSIAMAWRSALLICGLLVGGSMARSTVQRREVSALVNTSPVKYVITGEKDVHGQWTEQVKMEHGEEDWHIEVDHMTLEVGEGPPKVKITATFSAKTKTPDVTVKPEDSSEPVESGEELKEDFQLFPLSHRDWFGAKAQCEEWGGHLAVPDTKAKLRELTAILRQHIVHTGENTGAFVGFDDLKREGHFVTVLGKPLFSSQDSTWSPHWFQSDQPDDDKSWTKDGEDCGSLRSNGGLNDVPCHYNLPFICEKTTASETAVGEEGTGNTVAHEDKDEDTLHLFQQSSGDWFDAKKACVEWGGHLAIPDSEAKMSKMAKMLKIFTSSKTNPPPNLNAFVGFNDIQEEGQFVSIFGNPVFSSSASWSPHWFSPTQPDDDKGWSTEGEDCGAIHANGGLNDIPCRYHLPYFCEKTPHVVEDTTSLSTEDLWEEGSGEEFNALVFDNIHLISWEVFDWFTAGDACGEWGGHLAIPDSAEKLEVMTMLMKRTKVQAAFLGFGDQEEEGHFVTIFGKPVFSESSWSPSWWRDDQPDDDKHWYEDGEDCGSIKSDGGLNDVPCRHHMPFFCEIPLATAQGSEEELHSGGEALQLNPDEFRRLHEFSLPRLDGKLTIIVSGEVLSSEEKMLTHIIADVENHPGNDQTPIAVLESEEESSTEEGLSQMTTVTQNLLTLDDSPIVVLGSEEESSTEEGLSQMTTAAQNLPTLYDSPIAVLGSEEESSTEEELLQLITDTEENNNIYFFPHDHQPMVGLYKRRQIFTRSSNEEPNNPSVPRHGD